MTLRYYYIVLFTICLFALKAQTRIGSWEDHVSLNSAVSIANFNGKIYSANYSSVFIYDETDNSVEKINKIHGLSDVGIKFIRENPYNNRLLVVYENSNIDVIKSDNSINNYSDLFRKNFSGKKNVNEVFFVGKTGYLSCGFGIAKFDTEKLEITDTYILGPGGTNLEVLQFAITDSLYYAATPIGLYKCNYKTQSPNNYQNWKLITNGIPAGYYSQVVFYNNTILAAYSPYKEGVAGNKDTVYMFNSNNSWSKFPGHGFPYVVKKLKVINDKLCFMDNFGTLFLNNSYNNIAYVTQYDSYGTYPADATIADNTFWIADLAYGLIKTGGSNPFFKPTFIKTNGLNRSSVFNIDSRNGKVVTSAIYIDNGGGATYSKEGINVNENGEWSYLRKEGDVSDSLVDHCHVLFDKKDPSRIWVSSWINGLIEYRNNTLYKVYNGNNTGAMDPVLPGWWRASGKDMDEEGNLWFACSDVPKYLSVRKINGSFQNFQFDGTGRFVRKVYCDKSGQIWMLHERDQGITVAKFNKSSSNYTLLSYKILNKNTGTGNLGSNMVYAYAEDLDGKIWIGTSTGIRVFNSPSTILSGGSVDGEPIKIVQDGNVELLLEAEIVTCIDVDPANNKWVGTQAGGVYCFSPDGQRQLFHFTADNSPLYSNEINDLKVNDKTGDVFIASSVGLQSYKSVIIEGYNDYSSIQAFPNPVKPDYNGSLYVSGLVDNSVVKIADESGNFVWETKSQGGRIEWPLKTFAGNKVASGVYVIYAATTTAELKAVSKVLIMN